jgi:hypothetical protein
MTPIHIQRLGRLRDQPDKFRRTGNHAQYRSQLGSEGKSVGAIWAANSLNTRTGRVR